MVDGENAKFTMLVDLWILYLYFGPEIYYKRNKRKFITVWLQFILIEAYSDQLVIKIMTQVSLELDWPLPESKNI